MEKFVNTSKELLSFIEKSTDCFHAVQEITKILSEAGFNYLPENKLWEIKSGKYFTTRNGSSVIAFTVPENEVTGLSIVSAHSDSPTFKIKDEAAMKVEMNYTKLNTEPYGGMIMSTWLDRPLGISGRLTVKTDKGVKMLLADTECDYCVIPNLAIHMQRDINDGHKYNPQVDMLPLIGDENADLMEFFSEKYGIAKEDIISHDLFLYPREKGRVMGQKGEFIGSPRLDDLQCVFSAVKALLESGENGRVKIAAVFDNEEVGSLTKQGADGTFLTDTIQRLFECLNINENKKGATIARSFMLSADNAHAVHPNFTSVTDATNRNYLNKGIVIKFNASQKYTSDGVSAAVFKSICQKARVPYQVFHNRSDMRGGSTLGNISNAHLSLNTVDIGIPQLAMHSAFETAGVKDTYYMKEAMKAFYGTEIDVSGDEYLLS